MRRIPCLQDGDRLSASYLETMIIAPQRDELRRVRLLSMPTGLFRPPGSRAFNEDAVTIQRIVSRAPLTVRVACPATSGITPDGDYLECGPFECDVVLPLRDAFTLHLVRLPNQLPDTPIQSPVLLDEKFSLTTRGGLHVARGTVGRDLTPSLDDKWIAPTAVVGGSRKVCAAAAKLCERLEQLDGQFLASANTPETRTLLARWTGFFAAWRAMGDATPLDEYLVRTDRFLTQMWSDTRAIFGTEDHAAAGDADSLAGAFRRLMANVEGLAATWGSLLQTPMTMEIPLLCEPKQRRVGNHTEIILRAKQRPLPCESVIFKASTESPFGLDVAAVRVDLNESHTNRPPRTSLTAPAPGTVTCRIALTPEERAEGRIRLFVHRELNLSSITIEGD